MKNINIYNLKRWYKMFIGKSIFHVQQNRGLIYSKNEVRGYYNDLTQKVLVLDKELVSKVPTIKLEDNSEIIFPISVFQHGLGAYDLYLLTQERKYLLSFQTMVKWAIMNQQEDGSWNNFFYVYPKHPYSSMAQGEGVSLLVRAYVEFGEEEYLIKAKKALDFMLLSIKNGGTTLYSDDLNDVFFMEYTHKQPVLNGWIFSIFGLHDYWLVTKEESYLKILKKSMSTLERNIHKFDNGYWSMYDLDSHIASSFYHNLHIAQLKVLNDFYNSSEILKYLNKWTEYQVSKKNKYKAFIIKASQKILERD